ncbi:DUF1127 domain-containing protein [Muricoccus vinaceus]|uniref:DUF1127 domain-containing protein n=1 Tax=Muricoccus vinaceus TaxID=424704 RepID=A0ABV6IX30_9PROT
MELVLPGYRITVERQEPGRHWGRPGGPCGETPFCQALRWAEDRARLAAMDPRLLDDIGLTPEEVACGAPFQAAFGRRAVR